MKVCIAGKNDIAVACTEWLLSTSRVSRDELLLCPNEHDNGIDGFQRSLKRFAITRQLPLVNIRDLYETPDLVVFSLECDRILKINNFNTRGLYNIHFSKLPSYKGMYTSAWPILNGEKESGVTLHKIDAGIDTGDIIDQTTFVIEREDTARDLYFKYVKNGIDIFERNYCSVITGAYKCHAQSSECSSYYSSKSLDYKNKGIDLNKTAYQIKNQIRAFYFPEYQIPVVHSYQISRAVILPSSSDRRPGSMLRDADDYIDVATIDYDIRLVKACA